MIHTITKEQMGINKKTKVWLWILLLTTTACAMAWRKGDASWPWDKIETDEVQFSSEFLMGSAICEFQNSGDMCEFSTWNRWQNSLDAKGQPRIKHSQKSGKSCDFWHRFEEHIQLMQQLGHNTFRFSVDWSIIEPREGEFDMAALDHYDAVCIALRNANITPMITLHHFNSPIWFEDKGGFERSENIPYIVRFSKLVFERLGALVPLWCTINEPTIYTFQGYFRGVFPPGKKNLLMSYQVLRNLMQAHVEIYRALKAMPHGNDVQIGFAHQYLRFEPYTTWNPLEKAVCALLNPLLTETVFRFLSTGVFEYRVPSLVTIKYQVPRQEKFLDFLGINYYSRVLTKAQLSLSELITTAKLPHEIWTDMPYPMYAEGLYHAIARFSELAIPLYITETGIADAKDDRRDLFFRRYLFAIDQAIKDGYPVKGVYIWTLMDNFEWDEGWLPKFGICSFDHLSGEYAIRPGSQYFINVCKNRKSTI